MAIRRLNGEKVRELRMTRIGSQEQLASLLGVSVFTINRWETGRMIPRSTHFVKLVEVLRCDSEEEILL